MAKRATRPDELEGWGVRSGQAVIWIAVVLGTLWLSVGVMYWFYVVEGRPVVNTRPKMHFPAPELNARLDRDPHYSFAPPNPAETGPDPVLAAAMSAIAAKGDAGYGPLEPPPGGKAGSP